MSKFIHTRNGWRVDVGHEKVEIKLLLYRKLYIYYLNRESNPRRSFGEILDNVAWMETKPPTLK